MPLLVHSMPPPMPPPAGAGWRRHNSPIEKRDGRRETAHPPACPPCSRFRRTSFFLFFSFLFSLVFFSFVFGRPLQNKADRGRATAAFPSIPAAGARADKGVFFSASAINKPSNSETVYCGIGRKKTPPHPAERKASQILIFPVRFGGVKKATAMTRVVVVG